MILLNGSYFYTRCFCCLSRRTTFYTFSFLLVAADYSWCLRSANQLDGLHRYLLRCLLRDFDEAASLISREDGLGRLCRLKLLLTLRDEVASSAPQAVVGSLRACMILWYILVYILVGWCYIPALSFSSSTKGRAGQISCVIASHDSVRHLLGLQVSSTVRLFKQILVKWMLLTCLGWTFILLY